MVLGLSVAQAADACERVTFDGAGYTSCRIDLAETETRLFLRDAEGAIYGSFGRVEAALPPGKRLGVAMNAGMFHEDRSPVGHYVEDGVERMRVIKPGRAGQLRGLLPNVCCA